MNSQVLPTWALWLDPKERVVSFHPVRDFREQRFRDHDHFLAYVQDLQHQGYRFQ